MSEAKHTGLSPQQLALLRLIAPQCNGYAGSEGAPATFGALAARGLIERSGVFGRYVITEAGAVAVGAAGKHTPTDFGRAALTKATGIAS